MEHESDAREKPKFSIGLAQLARTYPIRFFIFYFFFMLGAVHLVNDLFRHFFSWHASPGYEYWFAILNAGMNTFILPRFGVKISDEQRAAEKKILEQADEITQQAQEASNLERIS